MSHYYKVEVSASDTPAIRIIVKAKSLAAARGYVAQRLATIERADTDTVLEYREQGGRIHEVSDAPAETA